MVKKVLILTAMFFITLTGAFAQRSFRVISLSKHGDKLPPIVVPFNFGDEISFEAYIDDAFLFVSATEPAEAYITVTSAMSVVASHHVTIGAGVEYQISMSDWTPGYYTLYILCNGELWTGEFEVE